MALKTNFTDDILAESMNGKRQYNFTENNNGTKSLEDVTEYQSVGSTFSAKDINETNAAVNQAYEDMGDEFNKNTKYLAGAVKIHNNKLWKFKVDHDPGEWDESQVKKTTLLDEIGELNEKLKAGVTTVTFKDSSGTLEHNCGFADTNYVLIFIPTTSSYFPMMSKPIDGNRCQIILRDWTNTSGNIAVKNFSGTAEVGWISMYTMRT